MLMQRLQYRIPLTEHLLFNCRLFGDPGLQVGTSAMFAGWVCPGGVKAAADDWRVRLGNPRWMLGVEKRNAIDLAIAG